MLRIRLLQIDQDESSEYSFNKSNRMQNIDKHAEPGHFQRMDGEQKLGNGDYIIDLSDLIMVFIGLYRC